MDDGTGKGEQLPLAGGEIVAPLPDNLVQTTLQLSNEGIGIDVFAGLPHFRIGDALHPQEDVAADGAGEQEHILQHLAEMAAKRGNFDLFDVDAVDQDLALLNVVVAADQGQNGGLSGAGGTDKSHGLLRLHMEGNALEHPFAGLVGEPNIFKFNLTLDLVQLDGIRLVHDFRNHIQNGEDFLRGSKGALEGVKLFCQGLDGVEELGDVHIERHDDLTGDHLTQEGSVLNVPFAAKIEQAKVGGDEQHIHHGAEYTENIHLAVFCFLQAFAALQEVCHFVLLLIENLGDLDAGEIL